MNFSKRCIKAIIAEIDWQVERLQKRQFYKNLTTIYAEIIIIITMIIQLLLGKSNLSRVVAGSIMIFVMYVIRGIERDYILEAVKKADAYLLVSDLNYMDRQYIISILSSLITIHSYIVSINYATIKLFLCCAECYMMYNINTSKSVTRKIDNKLMANKSDKDSTILEALNDIAQREDESQDQVDLYIKAEIKGYSNELTEKIIEKIN